MSVTGKIMTRYLSPLSASVARLRLPSRAGNFLLAGLIGYGVSAGVLIAGALAASVLPAQAPLPDTSLTMLKSEKSVAAQPMPPLPDQIYDARFHEGAVDLNTTASFAGIDPFITGPVPK